MPDLNTTNYSRVYVWLQKPDNKSFLETLNTRFFSSMLLIIQIQKKKQNEDSSKVLGVLKLR